MKKFICFLILLVMMTVFTSCLPGNINLKRPVKKPDEKTGSEGLRGNDMFSVRLADILYRNKEGNVLVSDISIKMALSMCLEGADGDTKDELLSYFGTDDISEVEDIMAGLLLRQEDSRDLKLILSNMMLYNDDIVLKDGYIKGLEEYLGIKPEKRKMATDKTVQYINDSVKKNTNGLIDRVVTLDDLRDAKALMMNTLYFKGIWVEPVEDTEYTDVFHGFKDDKDVTYYSDMVGTYYENDKAVAFAKEYKGGYKFIGILPKEEGDFELSDLDIEELLSSGTDEYLVNVRLPKLDIRYGGDITEQMKEDGLSLCFDPEKADLSNMSDHPVALKKMIHKTRLILDGEGTEAAAVTVIIAEDTAAMPEEKEIKRVYLDRPFAFLICSDDESTALFTGKIVEP